MAATLLKVTASVTESAREEIEDHLSEASAWIECVSTGALGASECAICGSPGPTEAHHLAGKFNSEVTVPVCRPCHRRLSERQNGWDPRWVLTGNPPDLKESFVLRGLSDLCEERGRLNAAYHILGKRLRAAYAKRARGSSS